MNVFETMLLIAPVAGVLALAWTLNAGLPEPVTNTAKWMQFAEEIATHRQVMECIATARLAAYGYDLDRWAGGRRRGDAVTERVTIGGKIVVDPDGMPVKASEIAVGEYHLAPLKNLNAIVARPIIGRRINPETGETVDVPEAEHWYRCAACSGWVDKRDLRSVLWHDERGCLPRPEAAA